MRNIIVAILIFAFAVSGAYAQTGVVSGATVTATGSTTPRTLADRFTQLPDVRDFGAVCDGTNNGVTTAVNLAVTSGVKTLWLPKNCTYQPTNNVMPDDLRIVGEDWATSLIISSSETTIDVMIGARSQVENIGLRDAFCYKEASPFNVSKVCPIKYTSNYSDIAAKLQSWVYGTNMVLGPTVTAPGATSVAVDIPGITLAQKSIGDAIWCGTTLIPVTGPGGDCYRMRLNGNNDSGLIVFSGLDSDPSGIHWGYFGKELGNNANSNLIHLTRVGDGTDVAPSVNIIDTESVSTTNSRPFIQLGIAHQGSGNIIQGFHNTTPFTGNWIFANFGGSTGTFTGNFEQYQKAGVTKYTLDSDGNVTAGAVTAAGKLSGNGTTTNNNAAVGQIGEYVSCSVGSGSPVALVSNTPTNICSMALTAGDWDVRASFGISPAGTTTTSQMAGGINTVSATFPGNASGGMVILNAALVAGMDQLASVGTVRISLAAPATAYLVGKQVFAVSTSGGYGIMSARRMR